ncbi:MAG: von Willebrand factor type A domain-containing protein, partial [Ginsengibacter sp.]
MKKLIVPLLAVFTLITAFRNKNITITGTVRDEIGGRISFVSVNAGSIATTSDQNGNYSINVGETQDYLVFSAVGFSVIKEQIKKRRIINVTMKANPAAMECVITTAFAPKKSSGKLPNIYAVSKPRGSHTPGGKYKDEDANTEEYSNITENGFHKVTDEPVSTFSIDVDAASYSNVRRFLNRNQLPPAGAVRAEEMINYFKYQYPQPTGKDPFSINTEIGNCPWNKENKLVLIGLQGKNIPVQNLPSSNLVFLIDVSGSMMDENKLPIVKAS